MHRSKMHVLVKVFNFNTLMLLEMPRSDYDE
jgi:hypothetical protein